ncbi:arsenate reductase family protein [Alkalilacustris brevis]|uniref:arsenate reductase family protein n=1 Tax=Alkalilacustris brevis TaxID=2026338 RepID=UPI000E0D1D46|nr:ArsC/Spx/MgsR family protein [Alkalilacustris brevis]
MELLGIPTCDTCRKARKALEDAGHEVQFRDIRKAPLSDAERTALLAVFGDALINRKSATWRALDDTARALPPAALLAEHATLMKRPVIRQGDRLHLGWGPETRAALLG